MAEVVWVDADPGLLLDRMEERINQQLPVVAEVNMLAVVADQDLAELLQMEEL
jgi:hypothetical protein